tara:strand:+ start:2283 stop:2438 length:156 start_codon:yes stop_codon:yes gene_type:complete
MYNYYNYNYNYKNHFRSDRIERENTTYQDRMEMGSKKEERGLYTPSVPSLT